MYVNSCVLHTEFNKQLSNQIFMVSLFVSSIDIMLEIFTRVDNTAFDDTHSGKNAHR